jgi:hypothetical protein
MNSNIQNDYKNKKIQVHDNKNSNRNQDNFSALFLS